MIDTAVREFGRVDTLVNNAGIFIAKPFTDYTAEDYEALIGVNLTGFVATTQLAIAQMLRQGEGGHVVQVTTSLVDHGEQQRPFGAGLGHQGRPAVGDQVAGHRVRQAGRPRERRLAGIIQTPMHAPESYDGLAGLHPVGRMGTISDIVDGVQFLEDAPFVTGEILHIDDGQSAGH